MCTYSQCTLFHGHVSIASETDMADSIPNELPVGLDSRLDVTLWAIVGEEGGL